MSLYVVKFGGSSVATTARIENASEIVKSIISKGNKVVVVTSAMQGVTNQLVEYAKTFNKSSMNREYDSIISSGEQVSSGLLALSLISKGINAKSVLGWQIPIKTTDTFSKANMISIRVSGLLEDVQNNVVPVVAGFQGISEKNDITTIGRGGSDATACALAFALKADECFIYTDVDGVYTADPRIVLNSKRLEKISFNEMLELAAMGAKVLQYRSVLIAKQFGIKLRVLSSFSDTGDTLVTNETVYIPQNKNIAGIAHNMNLCQFRIFESNLELFEKICSKKLNLEFVEVYDNSLSFLIEKSYADDVRSELREVGFEIDNDIGVVSLVGDGIKTEHETIQQALQRLKSKNIKIKRVSISDASVSIFVPFQQTELCVNELHKLFFEDGVNYV